MPLIGNAAVTATPATLNGRPSRGTLSPTRTPRASAKLRSTTTPSGGTSGRQSARAGQRQPAGAASFGQHGVGAAAAVSTGKATGNGPEYLVTPCARASGSIWLCAR